MVAGILLTGGRSRRLGVDKASVMVDGLTLAERGAGLLQSVCGDVVEVGEGRSGLPSIREDPPFDGPLAALLAGVEYLKALGADIDGGVVLLACDMPRLDVAALRVVVEFETTLSAIPAIAGRLQFTCARYTKRAIETARERHCTGERSFRWIVATELYAPIAENLFAHCNGAANFHDLDTPRDAAALGIKLTP